MTELDGPRLADLLYATALHLKAFTSTGSASSLCFAYEPLNVGQTPSHQPWPQLHRLWDVARTRQAPDSPLTELEDACYLLDVQEADVAETRVCLYWAIATHRGSFGHWP